MKHAGLATLVLGLSFAGIAYRPIRGMYAEAQRAAVLHAISEISDALLTYKKDTGSSPIDLAALRSKIPPDPWGRPYIYRSSSTPEIGTYGADGKPGGEGFDAD